MYAQITYFDGPRSPEVVAASHHAGRNRITPALLADDELRADHVATYVLEGPDGAQIVVAVANSESSLDRSVEVIMSTELLPDEDPALLSNPDRVQRLKVVHAVEHGRVVADVTV